MRARVGDHDEPSGSTGSRAALRVAGREATGGAAKSAAVVATLDSGGVVRKLQGCGRSTVAGTHPHTGNTMRPIHPIVRLLGATVALIACAGCSDATAPGAVAGSYHATTMLVTPDGRSPIDVVAGGGTLRVTLLSDSTVTGTLQIPASASGGIPYAADMQGSWSMTGTTLRFTQSADSFIRDLSWSVGRRTLSVVDQRAGTATFTITLTRD